jgi:hypothetical protein
MKAIEKLFVAAVSVLCLACVSCSQKEDVTNEYAPSWWRGEYAVQIENATTGTLEDHTALMELDFLENGKDVWIITGIPEIADFERHEYEANWVAKNQFTIRLYGWQSNFSYSGTIRDGIMTLQLLSVDTIVQTYELSRMPLLE